MRVTRYLVVGLALLAACSSASHKATGTPTTVKGPIFANHEAQECVEILAKGGTIDSCPPNNSSTTRPSTSTEVSSTAPSASATVVGSDSPALSNEGLLLWNFEALLHATFGNAGVSADAHYSFSNYYATCGSKCGPSAEHSGYVYTFDNATDSAFHIAEKPFGPDVVFGAHPIPVLIKGLPVACNAAETKFLIRYGDTVSFTLGCLSPAN